MPHAPSPGGSRTSPNRELLERIGCAVGRPPAAATRVFQQNCWPAFAERCAQRLQGRLACPPDRAWRPGWDGPPHGACRSEAAQQAAHDPHSARGMALDSPAFRASRSLHQRAARIAGRPCGRRWCGTSIAGGSPSHAVMPPGQQWHGRRPGATSGCGVGRCRCSPAAPSAFTHTIENRRTPAAPSPLWIRSGEPAQGHCLPGSASATARSPARSPPAHVAIGFHARRWPPVGWRRSEPPVVIGAGTAEHPGLAGHNGWCRPVRRFQGIDRHSLGMGIGRMQPGALGAGEGRRRSEAGSSGVAHQALSMRSPANHA